MPTCRPGAGGGQASLSQHLGGSRKSDVGLARWLALTGPQPCTPRPTPVFHSLESSSHLPHLRRFLSPNFSGRHRDHAHRSPKHGLRAPGPPPCGLQLQGLNGGANGAAASVRSRRLCCPVRQPHRRGVFQSGFLRNPQPTASDAVTGSWWRPH